MFNKFFPFCFSFVFILLVSFFSFAQSDSLILFVDDFESSTAGQQLVCQDSINWDTWSGIPCDPVEDPYISNTTANSGSNSVWIQQNNDLIKPIPDYDTGKFSIRFHLYIPTDYTASWGQLASFENPAEWGFYARFNPFGNGTIKIAADLGIHERTVKLHRTHVTTKLQVHSVAELTRLVQAAGFLTEQ